MSRRVVALALIFSFTGCTSLGHVPRYVDPAAMTKRTDPIRPSYTDVKELAYRQVSGYLVSGRINRDALFAGALIAGVSVATMAALSFFAPASMAMQLVPIGGGLAAGTAGVMQNEPKAMIYMRGALLTLDVIGRSDERIVVGGDGHSMEIEALCLRRDLGTIDRRVTEHILALNPHNIREQLASIGGANTAALKEFVDDVVSYNNLKTLAPACGTAKLPNFDSVAPAAPKRR